MMSHHHESQDQPTPAQDAAATRLLNELLGKARREWPSGRISADDDGVAAVAVAADPAHGVVRVAFAKPINWIGLRPSDARKLIDMLYVALQKLESRP